MRKLNAILCVAALLSSLTIAARLYWPANRNSSFPGKYYDDQKLFVAALSDVSDIRLSELQVPLEASRVDLSRAVNADEQVIRAIARTRRIVELTCPSKLSSRGMVAISELSGLKKLHLMSEENISDHSLEGLSRLKALESFACESGNHASEILTALAQCPLLRTAVVHGEASDDSVRAISKSKTLQTLNISPSALNSQTVLALSRMQSLRELYLRGSTLFVAPEVYDEVANGFSRLQELDLSFSEGLRQDMIEKLIFRFGGTDLSLCGMNFSEVAPDALRGARNLRRLTVFIGVDLSREVVAQIKKARPDLMICHCD